LNPRRVVVSFSAMPSTRTQVAPATSASPEPALTLIIAAFAAVYIIWGSTYLAILWVIESVPPLLMASARFLFAGALLYAWMRMRGTPRPSGGQWRAAVIAGTLMLAGGNGAVVVAEQWVPSGLTALLVAAVPLWLVLLDATVGSRARPTRRAQVGLLVGFVGVAILGGTPGIGGGGSRALMGALLVVVGSMSWAGGSLYLRTAPKPPSPLLLVAMQMLGGGAVLGVMSVMFGEPADFRLADVTLRSVLALIYLVIFGSLIAYTAYVWLLTVTTPARVGTYAYVNPVIALLLGWAFAGEQVGFRAAFAAAIIVGSVFVIVSEAKSVSDRTQAAPVVVGEPT
jgi:drug/metabolite transporter (DMT)-like permease